MYQVDFQLPYFIVRSADNTIDLSVLEDGEIVGITSGIVTVTDGQGAEIVSGATITVNLDGSASYTIAASVLTSDLPLSENWLVKWDIVIDGVTKTYRNTAMYVYQDLQPVVNNTSLIDRHTQLNHLLPSTDYDSWDHAINQAWNTIVRDLMVKGKRPWLILSPYNLYEAHVALSLVYIFRDLETNMTGAGRYKELEEKYNKIYNNKMDNLVLEYYDQNEDGINNDEKQVIPPIINITCGPIGGPFSGSY